MKVRVLVDRRRGQQFGSVGFDRVVRVFEKGRGMNVPLREPLPKGVEPAGDPGLASVDLLTASDRAHDRAPIWVSVHHIDEELGLGLIESFLPALRLHELRGLITVPGALGLIEDHDLFERDLRVVEVVVPEMVDVLDEPPDGSLGVGFLDALASDLVPGQGLAQDIDQWAVPREKHGVLVLMGVGTLGRDVEPGEGLARTRDPGDETDRFAAGGSSTSR